MTFKSCYNFWAAIIILTESVFIVNSKKVINSPPFRWFLILAIMLCFLSFVIFIHVLIEKCYKYWSNETSDSVDMENQEADEHPQQHTIVGSFAVINYIILVSFINFVRFSLQYHFLSSRFNLLLKDSESLLGCTIVVPFYYFKNPMLRHYICKKILRRSTVQPENNQIELQQIWTVLNKTHFISTIKITLLLSKPRIILNGLIRG